MTRTLTNVQAQVRSDELRGDPERQRREVEVRRVAVVHPGGSHFKLLTIPTSLAATGG